MYNRSGTPLDIHILDCSPFKKLSLVHLPEVNRRPSVVPVEPTGGLIGREVKRGRGHDHEGGEAGAEGGRLNRASLPRLKKEIVLKRMLCCKRVFFSKLN